MEKDKKGLIIGYKMNIGSSDRILFSLSRDVAEVDAGESRAIFRLTQSALECRISRNLGSKRNRERSLQRKTRTDKFSSTPPI